MLKDIRSHDCVIVKLQTSRKFASSSDSCCSHDEISVLRGCDCAWLRNISLRCRLEQEAREPLDPNTGPASLPATPSQLPASGDCREP